MLNEKEAKVVEIIQRRGPILPIEVSKELGVETFLASAILSTLINKGYVKISHRKVGSSPLYYISGQEQRVRSMLYPELNELEKKALNRLKELKVAFRDDLYPQERVLLSDLKDFVDYLQIKHDDKEVYCWRHYSVSDEEFNNILKEKFNVPNEESKPEVVKEVPAEEKQEIKEIKLEPKVETELKVEAPKETPKPKTKKPRKAVAKGELEKKAVEYFQEKGAKVLHEEIGRSESNFIISFETPVGAQKFFVKVKNKKSVSEGDMSKLYVEANIKKLPAVLITPASPNKKIMDYISKNFGDLIRIITLK